MNSTHRAWNICENEDRLIAANRIYWDKYPNVTMSDRNGWIYVLHTLTTAVLPCVHENIVAKGLQERENLPIVSVISGKANNFLDQLDESFGIEHRFHSSYHEFDNRAEEQKTEQIAEQIAASTYGNKDKLLELTYRGIGCGDVIYDDILRRGKTGKRGEVFDCFDISEKRYVTFIRNALAVIDKAYKLFHERKPLYLITSEYVYTKGLYANVALALGSKVLFIPSVPSDIAVQIRPGQFSLQDIKIADITQKMGQHYLRQYKHLGEAEENFFVLGSSLGMGEQEEQPKAGGKKKVFILPHALSDVPRQACRHTVYHDYTEWLLDTLRIAKATPEIDWIVKDHPMAASYSQGDYIRSVFEANSAPNIQWYDKNYSGLKIKDIADCVLTCAGDAGLEYWAYGIPTITTADAYYCKWGISYQMKSISEYEDTLKHIECIKPPEKKTVELAQKYSRAVKSWNKRGDLLAELFLSFRQKELEIFRKEGIFFENDNWQGSRLEEVACEFCDKYIQFLQDNSLKHSTIYRLENLWDMQIEDRQLIGSENVVK